jgi:hypothetical protein
MNSGETRPVRVVEIDPRDPRWDAYVETSRAATVFHHSGWITALEQENNQRLITLACLDVDGGFIGVLPLAVTRGLPFGLGGAGAEPRLSSLPRTPVAGPLASNPESMRALVEAAISQAQHSGLRLQLKLAEPVLDGLISGLRGTPWRSSYVKSLPADPQELRFGSPRNHARIRWAIGKAGREGLQVRDATDESDLGAWYKLYLEVNRRRGLPSRSYRFFRTAWRQLHPKGFLRLLLVDGAGSRDVGPVAGSMLLMLGDTVFYAFNGSLERALALRPNDLLQWHALRNAAASGYRWYDFGEVGDANAGLADFKAKWGTEVRRLVRYQVPPLAEEHSGYGRIEREGAVRKFALRAWRRMPLSLTAVAGDVVYRFL